MLLEFIRVTKSNGLMVILTAQKELMQSLLKKSSTELKLSAKYHTLISLIFSSAITIILVSIGK